MEIVMKQARLVARIGLSSLPILLLFFVLQVPAGEALVEGDLRFNNDFRGLYTDILEDWLSVDAQPIVKGQYEKNRPFANSTN